MNKFIKSRLVRFIFGIAIAIILGGGFYYARPILVNYFSSVSKILQDENGFFYATLFLTFMAAFLLNYVNKGIGENKNKNVSSYEELKSEVNSLKQEFSQLVTNDSKDLNGVLLTSEERQNLIAGAKKKIVGNTLLAADLSLKNDINAFKNQIEINKHYDDIVYRLETEIDRLNRRGGVNLVLGAFIAFCGILYLGLSVSNSINTNDKLEYILHMAPRLSFVIIIELFAYFFLKLYKNGFDEIKYFQNELTNIDSKVLAIKFLKGVGNENLMGEVIKNLMATERNFVLEKGQTTVSLEKEKISMDGNKDIAELLREVLKFKR
ncbi:hypothetical protein [Enterobacter sichuanensis]|uniref:Chemotaxis protein n=1 Tax=Enterobacter sichuanensis TaxID=2071710 RepID=A0ABS6G9P8_9ENTR|nr:hypothetical protein [Enterobacter sichuanensis]MBU5923533.1 hypothetical protein [Enterobacter sichuanensis]OZV00930.1 hypothetical protein CIW55_13805 [Enterobacter cloacae]PAO14232.1 hypothetical protein CIW58_12420 [Enterobacter cloacae]